MELTLLRSTQAGTSTGQTDAFIDLPKHVTLVIHAPPADLEGEVWNIIGALQLTHWTTRLSRHFNQYF